jgi:hypothetical protein
VGFSGIAAWGALTDLQREDVRSYQSFFLHQSVGADLEDGAQASGYPFEYLASGDTTPNPGLNGGLFNASNGNYSGKTAEFLATAIANQATLRVAIMKFGYADVVEGSLGAAKESYLNAVAGIKSKQIRVLHVTPPLVYGVPEENAPKMAFRSWMIETFPNDIIFDLEDVESTDPALARGRSATACVRPPLARAKGRESTRHPGRGISALSRTQGGSPGPFFTRSISPSSERRWTVIPSYPGGPGHVGSRGRAARGRRTWRARG